MSETVVSISIKITEGYLQKIPTQVLILSFSSEGCFLDKTYATFHLDEVIIQLFLRSKKNLRTPSPKIWCITKIF